MNVPEFTHQHPDIRCNKHLMWENRVKWVGEAGKPVLLMGTENITPSPTVKFSASIAVPDLKRYISYARTDKTCRRMTNAFILSLFLAPSRLPFSC